MKRPSKRRTPALYPLLTALLASLIAGRLEAQSGGRGASPGGSGSRPGGGGAVFQDDKPQYRPGLSETATDEIVVEIRVEGNKTIPANRVINEMQTRVGRNFDPRALASDVRKLASLPWFVDVKPLSEKTADGRVIVLRVVERPVVRYVEYLGNSGIRDKTLAEETGIDIGSAIDPYNVEEGRRKIEELYTSQGYPRARVTVLEGNKTGDKGVVYVINEGGLQRIKSVSFEGNDPEFATARRLKTKISSKPGWLFGLYGGKLNREQIDADVQALTDYYRQFGFYLARVGRVLEFDEAGEWVDIRYVINEGPRYHVRNVQFIGNEKFSDESLRSGLTLLEGQAFERTRLLVDNDWIKQLYGSQGHVFAEVRAEPVLLEEPGKVDLVYHIEEGEAWRVGRIFVHIGGENPHTRIQTALNRLSIRPGELLDIRELRASERRLQASQLYLADPQTGAAPKITYSIPELGDTEFSASSGSGSRAGSSSRPPAPSRTAGAGGSGYRGQSPEPRRLWNLRRIGERLRDRMSSWTPEQDAVDVHLLVGDTPAEQAYEAAPRGTRHTARKPPAESVYLQNAPRAPRPWTASPAPTSLQWSTPNQRTTAPPEFRGQSPGASPTAPGGYPVVPASAQPQAPAVPGQPLPPGYGQAPPGYGQAAPTATQAGFAPPPGPGNPAAPAVFNAPVGPPPGGQVVPAQFGFPAPTTAPGAPASRVIGAPTTNPSLDPSVLPLPGASGQFFPGGQFGPVAGDNFVDINVVAQEGQTGRFSVGVGVNSDAGVIGNIVLDERNFDIRRWPSSFRDVRNGTAFRGGGQRFRLEAAPGSQVQRYLASFSNPYLFDSPISLQLSGSLFDRRFEDYDEGRLGGRIGLGYQWVENDLSASITYRGESVEISDPVVTSSVDAGLDGVLGTADDVVFTGSPELDEVLGTSDLHGFGIRIANDTRNNPFLPTEGRFIELQLEQVVGTFDYPRAILDARKYFLLRERPDHSGRHVLQTSTRLGFTGSNTPLFDNFFAGGFSTLRGFDFRGASPVAIADNGVGVDVGGEFMWLNSVEYLFPITADDTVSGVVFCDFGTVERSVTIEDFRVAPGFGLRLQVPAFGPAPIALDFAFPVSEAATDDTQVFTFNIGFLR